MPDRRINSDARVALAAVSLAAIDREIAELQAMRAAVEQWARTGRGEPDERSKRRIRALEVRHGRVKPRAGK